MIPLIRLPAPLTHQREVLEAQGRFKVIVAGRKWGKTVFGLIACVAGHGPGRQFQGALYGKNGMWVAPVEKIAEDIWRALKQATAGCWVEKSEVQKRIVFPGGGSITVRSAHEPDNLRGPNLDFIVIDEAAYIPEEAWNLVLRPTLAATGGWVIFISTPCGQNWFWKLYENAKQLPGWKRWRRPTSDNPKVSTHELQHARLAMGSYAFRQEHLAEFVAPGGGLFKPEHAHYYERHKLVGDARWLARLEDGTLLDPSTMTTFVTVDTATSAKTTADFTSISCWGWEARGRLFLLDLDLRRLDGATIMRQIVRMCDRWSTIAYVEENSTSKHLLSFMDSQRVPYRTVEPGTTDKRTRALPASAMWERGAVFLPRTIPSRPADADFEAEREFMLPEAETQLFTFTGASKTVNVEGLTQAKSAHDDFVDTLAYAARVCLDEFNMGERGQGLGAFEAGPPQPDRHILPGLGLADPFKKSGGEGSFGLGRI